MAHPRRPASFSNVLYLSIAIHLAVGLILGGVTVFKYLTPDEAEFVSADYNPPDIERVKYKVTLQKRSRDTSSPKPQLIEVKNSPVKLTKIQVTTPTLIKGNARGRGKGKGNGYGWGTGEGGFMGVDPPGSHTVIVIDVSSSMRGDKFENVLKAAESTIRSLPRNTRFNLVVFWGEAGAFQEKKMVAATTQSKDDAIKWLGEQDPSKTGKSGTNPVDGLRLAFAMKPESIILLSDGEPSRGMTDTGEILAEIKKLQSKTRPRVNISTIAYKTERGVELMEKIAAENRGEFVKR